TQEGAGRTGIVASRPGNRVVESHGTRDSNPQARYTKAAESDEPESFCAAKTLRTAGGAACRFALARPGRVAADRNSARCWRDRYRGGRRTGPPHKSAESFLARVGADQARFAAILPGRFALAVATRQKPRHGDEALSQRSARPVFFYETRAAAAAGLHSHLLDRACLRKRHRISRHSGRGLVTLGDKPGLHRPESLVRAVRRRMAAGLFALRPGPDAGDAVRARAGNGADRAGCACGAEDQELCQDDRV